MTDSEILEAADNLAWEICQQFDGLCEVDHSEPDIRRVQVGRGAGDARPRRGAWVRAMLWIEDETEE